MTPEWLIEFKKLDDKLDFYIEQIRKYEREIERLTAENERYKKALRAIADKYADTNNEMRMQEIACEALKDG